VYKQVGARIDVTVIVEVDGVAFALVECIASVDSGEITIGEQEIRTIARKHTFHCTFFI
jgi:hypothetical protein